MIKPTVFLSKQWQQECMLPRLAWKLSELCTQNPQQMSTPLTQEGEKHLLRSEQNISLVTKKELRYNNTLACLPPTHTSHFAKLLPCCRASWEQVSALVWSRVMYAVRCWWLKALRSSLQRVMTPFGAVDWQPQCTPFMKQELFQRNTADPSHFTMLIFRW